MAEPRTRQAGFTLLEVMVALAVFATAAIALIDLQRESLRASSGVAARAFAQIVAENRLVGLRLGEEAPEPGTRRGESELGGRTWYWRERIIATQTTGLRRLEVDVRRQPEGQILAHLAALKEVS